MTHDTFQERLRRARKAKNLSQQHLADKLGVAVGSVGNWEVGPSKPRPRTLGKIADILEISSEKLLYGSEGALREPRPNYAGTDDLDLALRDKCRDHFEKFLANCIEAHHVGWFYIELCEQFPLNKFSSKPPSGAQESANQAGKKHEREHPQKAA